MNHTYLCDFEGAHIFHTTYCSMTEKASPTHAHTYSLELLRQKENKGKNHTKTSKAEVILINATSHLGNKGICTIYIGLKWLVAYFLDFAHLW